LCTYKYAYVVCFILGKLDPEEWCCGHEKIFEAQLLVFKLFLMPITSLVDSSLPRVKRIFTDMCKIEEVY
jgi:hypothetical protein